MIFPFCHRLSSLEGTNFRAGIVGFQTWRTLVGKMMINHGIFSEHDYIYRLYRLYRPAKNLRRHKTDEEDVSRTVLPSLRLVTGPI